MRDYKGIFPPHRYHVYNLNEKGADDLGEKHWYQLFEQYTKSREVPHCPTLARILNTTRV
jgi:hypothetical protein